MDWKLVWQIFWLFTRVALFSWGGGQASLGLMQREVVAAGWITSEEFADGVALGSALPGPSAPQSSAFVGYKLAGWPGAIAAVTGTVVPTTLLVIVFISLFFAFKNHPFIKAAIQGVRPFVVGLLAWTACQLAIPILNLKAGLGQSVVQGWDKWLIAVGVFVLLTFTNLSPIWLVLGAALVGLIFYR